MQYRNYQEAIDNIDWSSLQRQKRILERLLSERLDLEMANIPRKKLKDLWGLIEFIENLQDAREKELLGDVSRCSKSS